MALLPYDQFFQKNGDHVGIERIVNGLSVGRSVVIKSKSARWTGKIWLLNGIKFLISIVSLGLIFVNDLKPIEAGWVFRKL